MPPKYTVRLVYIGSFGSGTLNVTSAVNVMLNTFADRQRVSTGKFFVRYSGLSNCVKEWTCRSQRRRATAASTVPRSSG